VEERISEDKREKKEMICSAVCEHVYSLLRMACAELKQCLEKHQSHSTLTFWE